ncbi:MAG: hypothetical protein JSR67_01700 [Proteobacteria bacterium]|nr:hypothetical protein [Pseudomonadota bacterium]
MSVLRFGCLAAAATITLTLGACGHEGRGEMSWARAALERNPNLEIVASSARDGTFTVRRRDSGALQVIRADQLAAMPQAAAPPDAGGAVARADGGPAAGSPPTVATVAPAGTAAAAQSTAAPLPEAGGSEAPDRTGMARVRAVPQTGGRIIESGPGYSIESAAGPSGTSSRQHPPATAVTSAAVERRHDPIVCQGARLLHIDNRNLVFDGDAVSAEDGCEIHITNSHISAAGFGILARAANVHIDNSQIEGDAGSIEATDGAQVYATSSRFRGLSRRLDNSSVHDLGGNVWN